MKTKIKAFGENYVHFENGWSLWGEHDQDCCEHHYLDFSYLKDQDWKDKEFDLTSTFFERVEDYGIRLRPLNGLPMPIPGYGYNNGYYGNNINLVVYDNGKFVKEFDVTECQSING